MAKKKVFTDESLATFVDEIKAYTDSAIDAIPSDHFIVNFTANDSGRLSADKTFAEIDEAFENSKMIIGCCYGTYLRDCNPVSTNGSLSGYTFNYNTANIDKGREYDLNNFDVIVNTDESVTIFVAQTSIGISANLATTDKTIVGAINELNTNKADVSHTHTIANITNLQTTLDGKAASSHNHAASNITSGTLSSDRLPTIPIAKGGTGATTAAGALTNLGLTATATELNYVDGVTSSIQTQLNGKASTATATQAANGLLSAGDKTQLDYGGIPIVTTAGSGSAYTATVDGIGELKVGTKITIIPHVVSAAYAPTLNVNSLGAKAIRMPVSYSSATTANGATTTWLAANKPVTLEYNGTYWLTVGLTRPSANYLSGTVPIANGGTGATDAATALSNLGLTATAEELNSCASKYADSDSAGGAANTVKVTEAAPTSNTAYYPVFSTGTGSASLNRDSNIIYKVLEGTTSTDGVADLWLGNNIASGTAGNKQGKLVLYSTGTNYGYIVQPEVSSNIRHTLPDSSGVLLNSVNYADYVTFTPNIASCTLPESNSTAINGASVQYMSSAYTYSSTGDGSCTAQANGVKINKDGYYDIYLRAYMLRGTADNKACLIGLGCREYISVSNYTDDNPSVLFMDGGMITYNKLAVSLTAGTLLRPTILARTTDTGASVTGINFHSVVFRVVERR